MTQAWELILLGDPRVLTPTLVQTLRLSLDRLGAHVTLRCPAIPGDVCAPGPQDLVLLFSEACANVLAQVDWRAFLHAQGWSYQVVWGTGDSSRQNALHALAAHAHRLGEDTLPLRTPPAVRWQGVCESCGDADCEHRLFGRLLQGAGSRR